MENEIIIPHDIIISQLNSPMKTTFKVTHEYDFCKPNNVSTAGHFHAVNRSYKKRLANFIRRFGNELNIK